MLKISEVAQCSLATLFVFICMRATACIVLFIIDAISKMMAHIGLKDKDLPKREIEQLKAIKEKGIVHLLFEYINRKFNI